MLSPVLLAIVQGSLEEDVQMMKTPTLLCRVLLAIATLPWFIPCAVAADEFRSEWRRSPDRIWVGPAYHANRWQDWRIKDGRLECTETAARLAMRTVQVLTDVLDPETGQIEISVRLGIVEHGKSLETTTWGGLSIGAGGDGVDYRRTAMVHHVPAADGGILALVDTNCNVTLRDNEHPIAGLPLWSIAREVTEEQLPELPGLVRKSSPTGTMIGPDGVQLDLLIKPDDVGYTVEATVLDSEGVEILSKATASGLPLAKVEGGFGLVSHQGPKQSRLGWWFSGLRAMGPGVMHFSQRAFGPILGTLYTLDEDIMKMTVQFPPLGEEDEWSCTLQIQPGVREHWKTIASAPIDRDSRTATFRIDDWASTQAAPYRIVYSLKNSDGTQTGHEYHGVVRAEPEGRDPLLLGALTCHKTYTGGLAWNGDGLWLPHEELVSAVAQRDPDMLYFSGDQIYEGDLTPAGQRNEDAYILDYLWKYSHWIWAFRDITRNRPTVVIPDDHDVYHGNIWAAGGRRAARRDGMTAQDSGGYKHGPRFVNAVHRTQVAHLPDPLMEGTIGEGYTVYFTEMTYGGISFAIIGDRQFKESPSVAVPEGKVKNGWFTAEGFDVVTDGDAPDAPLLGEDQEAFLARWVEQWDQDVWMKVLLSQTPFACVQTLPEGSRGGVQPSLVIFEPDAYAPNDVPCSDADSNAWPQSGRNRALSILQRAPVLHICGDQHLAFVAQYGIDEHRDAGVVFCTPAIANTWPRRWMPRERTPNGDHGDPRPFGDHLDGFGNKISVDAVANPHKRGIEPAALHDRSPGFGLVAFDPAQGSFTLEAWPRGIGLDPSIGQYEGWPIELTPDALSGLGWGFQLDPTPELEAVLRPGVLVTIIEQATKAPRHFRWVASSGPASWRVPGSGQYQVIVTNDRRGQVVYAKVHDARPTTESN